jgi:hypothetical protein
VTWVASRPELSSVPRVPSERLSQSSSSASFLWLVLDTRSQRSREMSGGHDEGHGEGHGAHLDCAGAADTMAPFKPVSDTLWNTFAVKNYKRIPGQENGVRCVERLRV